MQEYINPDKIQTPISTAENTQVGKQAAQNQVIQTSANNAAEDNSQTSKNQPIDMSKAQMGFGMLQPEETKNLKTGEIGTQRPLKGGQNLNAATQQNPNTAESANSGQNLNLANPTSSISGGTQNLENTQVIAPKNPAATQNLSQRNLDPKDFLIPNTAASNQYGVDDRLAFADPLGGKMDIDIDAPPYTIAADGETLESIAKAKEIEVKALREYNGERIPASISDTTPLKKGGQLWINAASSPEKSAQRGIQQLAAVEALVVAPTQIDKNSSAEEIDAFVQALEARIDAQIQPIAKFLEDMENKKAAQKDKPKTNKGGVEHDSQSAQEAYEAYKNKAKTALENTLKRLQTAKEQTKKLVSVASAKPSEEADKKTKKEHNNALDGLNNTRPEKNQGDSKEYMQILTELDALENSDVLYKIVDVSSEEFKQDPDALPKRTGEGGVTTFAGYDFEKNREVIEVEFSCDHEFMSATETIAHELKHAYQYETGLLAYNIVTGAPLIEEVYDYEDEVEAFKRQEFMLEEARAGSQINPSWLASAGMRKTTAFHDSTGSYVGLSQAMADDQYIAMAATRSKQEGYFQKNYPNEKFPKQIGVQNSHLVKSEKQNETNSISGYNKKLKKGNKPPISVYKGFQDDNNIVNPKAKAYKNK